MERHDPYKDELERYLKCFGANVRRARLATQRLSQERLAEETRLHRTEIGRIELGKVDPRLTTLVILADGLNTTIDDLAAGLWVPVHRKPEQGSKQS